MKSRAGQKIKLTSIDELLGVVNEESAMEIEISKIHSFEDHPFKVMDDEKMDELVESIRNNGVLVPVLLRPDDNNGYEMVSGHRRMHASQILGLDTIPAIVREMSRDDAVIAMVDANIQREELLPSEKAFAYKMKMDAMSRQGHRSDLQVTSNQNDWKLETADIISAQVGTSKAQVRRFIRLTELIPELLEMVDNKKLNFTIAVDISYIDKQVQGWLYEYICDNGFIKPNQVAELRKYIGQGNMTQPLMISILNSSIPIKAPAKKITFTEKKLSKYFPQHYSSAEMERVIVALLEKWKEEQEEA